MNGQVTEALAKASDTINKFLIALIDGVSFDVDDGYLIGV
jgi:uncharacterized FlaG/YvyC family protein